MKKIVYTLLLCAVVGTTFAQTGKDCITAARSVALLLFLHQLLQIRFITDAVPNSAVCGGPATESATGWNNTTWVTFLVTTGGTLQMNFDANPNADIDFALWRVPAGTSLSTVLRYLPIIQTNRRCDYDASSTASGFGARPAHWQMLDVTHSEE